MEIVTALITGLCVAVPSIIATIWSNKNNVKLTLYRIDKLEEKVNKHNQLIERTFKLEGQMQEVQHDISEIKSKIA